ncbi:hypothetical protein QTP88_009730 [Uroleucon formosanum]
MSNKNTVSPLIIQKSRIQSVPNNSQNKSPISPSTPTSRDGLSFPTNSKRLISPSQSLRNNEQKKQATYVSKNRFSLFATNETVDTDHQSTNMDLDNEPITATKPPPPIFIRTVNDYSTFCALIKELIKCDNFSCKSSINGIKLSTETAESYRSVIQFLQENKADFHTYQLKQEKAYRVVLRNLHHTTPINVIKNELESLGHTARNITNVLQRTTKMPLPIFFIDLEPALNNKDIFKIEFIYYTKIKVEEPRFNHQTIQCLRCQGFGHTKSYCYHPPKCVRCGENHLSDTCQKSKSLPAKCALYHTPVILILNDTSYTTKSYPTLTPGKTNWSTFRNILDNTINLNTSLKTPTDIESTVLTLTSLIRKAAIDSSTKTSDIQITTKVIPQHISQLICEKRRARAKWQRTHLHSDKRIYNNLTTSLKNTLRKFNSNKFHDYLNSIKNADNSLWKATKNILREKTKIAPLRYPDNSLAISNLDKANLFATDLEKRFTPHPDIQNRDHMLHVESLLNQTLPMSLPTNHTSPSEILHIINKLHNNKAPGHDLITNRIIKNLPKKTIIFLTFIFNSILRLSYIPPSWKHSIIILIHKPGKPENLPSSFRPISLLPSFSKILEKIILKRIYPIINVQNTIPNTQFGFRNKHSALHQVHRIVDNIASSLERKYFCSAVFLDVAQAFDRVWHKGLLYKTRFLPAPLYLIINSFLSNRTFQVRCDDVLSETHSAKAGVPQGSILAPTLYNIYTSDIPHSHLTSLATFADDTCIISFVPDIITSTENLQSHLNDLQNWFNLWRKK